MALRDDINSALKQAMRDRAADRLSTLRLIMAAIKDRDIAAFGRQPQRDGLADALAATGYDCGFAFEIMHFELLRRKYPAAAQQSALCSRK